MAKTKMRVPKYLAGVSVVQPEKRSVTSVEVEKVVLMPPMGMFMAIPALVVGICGEPVVVNVVVGEVDGIGMDMSMFNVARLETVGYSVCWS